MRVLALHSVAKMCRWRSNYNGPVLLKWPFYCTKTVNKCVWLRRPRMKMRSNLKFTVRFFHVCALEPRIKTDLASLLIIVLKLI